MFMKKGQSRCYDCYPKPKQKSFQVCTIRTLPEKPLHCITWAKYLFELLFGANDDSNVLSDLKESVDFSNQNEFPLKLIQKLFFQDIQSQINSEPDVFNHIF